MIGKTNALAASGGVDYDNAPDITFSGNWLKWFVEFYDGEPYWEAWFLSSGTLTVNGSYTADAWGIGGGSCTYWNNGSGNPWPGLAGIPNMRTGISLTGAVVVTIGAGGTNTEGFPDAGGATMLGSFLTCSGGAAAESYYTSITDSYKRYRFESSDKSDEAGNNRTDADGYKAQGGWLKINRALPSTSSGENGVQGDGFGGGGGYAGYAGNGALVIRIKM